MSKKRYIIARVKYDVCPIKYMIPKSYKNRCILHNRNCEQCGRTGDTKEQMIRKIKQVIFRNFKNYNLFMVKFLTPHLNSFAYKIAKEIVKFLGVE